jgi:hypothetical protein
MEGGCGGGRWANRLLFTMVPGFLRVQMGEVQQGFNTLGQ